MAEVAPESTGGGDSGAAAAAAPPVSKKNKYRKPKPWDNDSIDHWKVDEWKADFMPAPLMEETSFAVLFPAYREKYLREVWPAVTAALKRHGLRCVLDVIEGSMTVKTTRKTWDPFIVIKARDLLRLLSRSVPLKQALRVLDDDMQCDIIKIGGTVRNKERFIKRRARLLGPNGATLKALELLTECYVLVQGNTVAAMGGFKGLKIVRRIVLECMNNVHPVYNIKQLMIKRELAKDPALAKENWSRFLPKFKKRAPKRAPASAPIPSAGGGQQKRSKRKGRRKGDAERSPFPPAQPPSKMDLALESGEYFMSQDERSAERMAKRAEARAAASAARKAAAESAYVPPSEPVEAWGDGSGRRGRKRSRGDDGSASVAELKQRLLEKYRNAQAAPAGRPAAAAPLAESAEDAERRKKKKKKKKQLGWRDAMDAAEERAAAAGGDGDADGPSAKKKRKLADGSAKKKSTKAKKKKKSAKKKKKKAAA